MIGSRPKTGAVARQIQTKKPLIFSDLNICGGEGIACGPYQAPPAIPEGGGSDRTPNCSSELP